MGKFKDLQITLMESDPDDLELLAGIEEEELEPEEGEDIADQRLPAGL